jgi:hypothetical protein
MQHLENLDGSTLGQGKKFCLRLQVTGHAAALLCSSSDSKKGLSKGIMMLNELIHAGGD